MNDIDCMFRRVKSSLQTSLTVTLQTNVKHKEENGTRRYLNTMHVVSQNT